MTVSVQGSFHRSVNLTRDFYGTQGLGSYIVTSKAREMIERIVEIPSATQMIGGAWSITGPYGGGKSSFALFLAHLLHRNDDAVHKLSDADLALSKELDDVCGGIFCPVLVVGSREPLSKALLRGLINGTSSFYNSYERKRGQPSKKVRICRAALQTIMQEAEAAASSEISDDIVIDLYQRTAAAVRTASNGGLLLIVDELGKLLEYSALYPDRSDLYLLQRLAERASRKSDTLDEAAPILIITISHQSIERYSGRMSSSQRDEWRKVHGRFEDFAFVEPISETLRLLAEAIHLDEPDRLPNDCSTVVDKLLDTITFRPVIDSVRVSQHLASALPLHPAVSLIVGPLFRRLAQNERSLFAFLASGEPSSFLDLFKSRDLSSGTSPTRLPLYRLDHLYDYLVGSVGTALFSQHMGKLWAETEATLSRLKSSDELDERLVKQIAMLSFAGPLAGLSPTKDVLYATADATYEAVNSSLDSLITGRHVVFRPFKGEYHIWQGSDFDLDAALQHARNQISTRTPLSTLLAAVLPPTPVVARRHSFRTGTTRVFEVLYASEMDWPELLEKPRHYSDGRIIYVLPDQDGQEENLISSIQELINDPLTLVAVPDGVSTLHEIVREFAYLKWVRDHADELQGDKVARHEVDQQLTDLKGYVEQRLTSLLVADTDGRNPCTWIYQGKHFRLTNERSVQNKLSQICNEVFTHSPQIWNELLNRQKPSPSAVKGLKILLKAILEQETVNRLGIEKYPAEYGMYASILQSTGIHRQSETDPELWCFGQPDSTQHSGCVAIWKKVTDILLEARGRRVPVKQLYDLLRLPPYGVRAGLMPVFLFAIIKSAEDEIALYENGTFIPSIEFETIERFLKSPEKFELQWVTIEGNRAELLHSLAPLVGLSKSVQRPLPLALRILERIHGLPPYVRRTGTLSQIALNVREVLHRAVEPTTLLFEDLPEACGVSSFLANNEASPRDVGAYTKHLQKALRELSGAYESLLADLETKIANVFRLKSKTSEDRRHELSERVRLLLPHASDIKLKAFLVRATDEILDTQSWYESLASLLAKRPPMQWRDEDVPLFFNALREVARRFYMLEPIAFDIQQAQGEIKSAKTGSLLVERIRLSVTMQYRDEHEQIISIHPEDRDHIMRVYRNLRDQLAEENVTTETKIAALAQLSNELLAEREEVTKSNE
ncbi:MAG: hypothetical protein F4019_04810 [Rhodothermaceae bacterium]|nr:hypothetical protein [Rhodothermaceae bacterium]MYD68266.1 hypothetical protein [Rhodothermaceae bacterium]MYG44256.1 hypothetical protein [Rhodothermaceae bacterium]MYH11366.1 hypothetical protein [Rhodothermaceae bacterium]MYK63502.1 hypothetical protein [Rhodothermaceae bacterium]